MNDLTPGSGTRYPSILFRLNGGLFCADSRHISTIMELPEHKPLPDAPDYITGIFSFRGGSVTMFDLRIALKLRSLSEDFDSFSKMLDDRKQDHINWVNALERTLTTGDPFLLATDSHKCKLGRWYDNFDPSSSELSSHLAKMVEPHQRLHQAALSITKPNQALSSEKEKERVRAIFSEAHDTLMPNILDVLEGAKEIFRSREYNEMVLVLSGATSLGIVVDEVLSVEVVEEEEQGSHQQLLSYSPYINRVVRSANYTELILDVNIPALLQSASELPVRDKVAD